MATLATNERAVRLVRLDESIAPGRSAQALDAGVYVSLNAAGEYAPGAGAGGGINMNTVVGANAPVSVLKEGIVELGGAIAAMDFGAPVYAAADGTLDDADGAGANTRVGTVIAGLGEDPPRKLLQVG